MELAGTAQSSVTVNGKCLKIDLIQVKPKAVIESSSVEQPNAAYYSNLATGFNSMVENNNVGLIRMVMSKEEKDNEKLEKGLYSIKSNQPTSREEE
jgi:hypothetical protein